MAWQISPVQRSVRQQDLIVGCDLRTQRRLRSCSSGSKCQATSVHLTVDFSSRSRRVPRLSHPKLAWRDKNNKAGARLQQDRPAQHLVGHERTLNGVGGSSRAREQIIQVQLGWALGSFVGASKGSSIASKKSRMVRVKMARDGFGCHANVAYRTSIAKSSSICQVHDQYQYCVNVFIYQLHDQVSINRMIMDQ